MNPELKKQWLNKIETVIAHGPFTDSWDSLEGYRIPEWYQDAKFGIFIHWGVYSVPAFSSEWYPRMMYIQGSKEYEHHIKTYGKHKDFGYKDFIPMFKAEKFDPNAWAELFKKSGARYVMPVAEHHDGFQMYDSELSKWNAKQMGPCRDVVGELADEVRKQGMVFSASSHRAEHWWFMGEGRYYESDVNDPAYEDFYGPATRSLSNDGDNYYDNSPGQEYLEDWLVRTCEIIDKYQPQVLWFDWWIMNLAFKPYLKKMAAFYYNRGEQWGKGVAINYKYDAFLNGTAVFDVERGQLSGIRRIFWQTDTALAKNSWGYTEGNSYKEADDIICDLVDIVSKNGALLMNIGPRPDGTIPEQEVELLLEIGKWLDVNGDAIYNTRPWIVYGEGETKVADGAFTDCDRKKFTSRDVRYTRNGDTVYAIVLKWPENGQVELTAMASLIEAQKPYYKLPKAVSVLGSYGNVSCSLTEKGLLVEAADVVDNGYPVAIKLEY